MFKLLKLLFFGLLVLVGLYFFGNFKINDIHVKNYLHEKITLEKLILLKEHFKSIYTGMKYVFSSKSVVEPQASGDTAGAGKTLEQISKQDQERLLKLLQKNLNTEKLTAPERSDGE